jgi:hypothetical protein
LELESKFKYLPYTRAGADSRYQAELLLRVARDILRRRNNQPLDKQRYEEQVNREIQRINEEQVNREIQRINDSLIPKGGKRTRSNRKNKKSRKHTRRNVL